MKLGDAEYVAKVQELLNSGQCVSHSEARRRLSQSEGKMHKVTQMTEEETAQEVAKTTEGVFKPDTTQPTIILGEPGVYAGPEVPNPFYQEPKKKRGRPLGSKNKPKVAL